MPKKTNSVAQNLPVILREDYVRISASVTRATMILMAKICGLQRLKGKFKSETGFDDYKYACGKALLVLRLAVWHRDTVGMTGILKEFAVHRPLWQAVQRDDFDFFINMGRVLSSGQTDPQTEDRDQAWKVDWFLINYWLEPQGDIPALCRLTPEGLAAVSQHLLHDDTITADVVVKKRQRLKLLTLKCKKINAILVGTKLRIINA